MIIFLYGPDTYRSQKKLKEIVAQYKSIHKSGMSFGDISAEDGGFEDFKNSVGSVSMFGEKKLLVVRNSVATQDFAKQFVLWEGKDALKDSADTICVFLDKEIGKKNSLALWLLKNARCQEFETLKGVQLNKWVKQLAAKEGVALEAALLYRLAASSGGDLWALENEIKKLKAYASSSSISTASAALEIPSLSPDESKLSPRGSLGIIKNEDLDVFLEPALQAHIFSFVDAVAGNNKKKAFSLLRGHFSSGDSGGYLFYMLVQQFRNIALARDLQERGVRSPQEVAQKAKMHLFVAKKSLVLAGRFNKEEIKKIYRMLMEVDRDVKTGKIQVEDALEGIILSRSRFARSREARPGNVDE